MCKGSRFLRSCTWNIIAKVQEAYHSLTSGLFPMRFLSHLWNLEKPAHAIYLLAWQVTKQIRGRENSGKESLCSSAPTRVHSEGRAVNILIRPKQKETGQGCQVRVWMPPRKLCKMLPAVLLQQSNGVEMSTPYKSTHVREKNSHCRDLNARHHSDPRDPLPHPSTGRGSSPEANMYFVLLATVKTQQDWWQFRCCSFKYHTEGILPCCIKQTKKEGTIKK